MVRAGATSTLKILPVRKYIAMMSATPTVNRDGAKTLANNGCKLARHRQLWLVPTRAQ